MGDREKVIEELTEVHDWLGHLITVGYHGDIPDYRERKKAVADALAMLKEQEGGGWISADKRPPKQGRYLVWGLTRITPDHYDEANGFWEIQPAFWFEKSGWDRKVKFWQMLPEPPEEVSGDGKT